MTTGKGWTEPQLARPRFLPILGHQTPQKRDKTTIGENLDNDRRSKYINDLRLPEGQKRGVHAI